MLLTICSLLEWRVAYSYHHHVPLRWDRIKPTMLQLRVISRSFLASFWVKTYACAKKYIIDSPMHHYMHNQSTPLAIDRQSMAGLVEAAEELLDGCCTLIAYEPIPCHAACNRPIRCQGGKKYYNASK